MTPLVFLGFKYQISNIKQNLGKPFTLTFTYYYLIIINMLNIIDAKYSRLNRCVYKRTNTPQNDTDEYSNSQSRLTHNTDPSSLRELEVKRAPTVGVLPPYSLRAACASDPS